MSNKKYIDTGEAAIARMTIDEYRLHCAKIVKSMEMLHGYNEMIAREKRIDVDHDKVDMDLTYAAILHERIPVNAFGDKVLID